MILAVCLLVTGLVLMITLIRGQGLSPTKVEHLKVKAAGTDAERELVVVKKVRKTDKRYPRKAGVPGKEPI